MYALRQHFQWTLAADERLEAEIRPLVANGAGQSVRLRTGRRPEASLQYLREVRTDAKPDQGCRLVRDVAHGGNTPGFTWAFADGIVATCGRSLMVKLRLPKPMTRVRFPSPALFVPESALPESAPPSAGPPARPGLRTRPALGEPPPPSANRPRLRARRPAPYGRPAKRPSSSTWPATMRRSCLPTRVVGSA